MRAEAVLDGQTECIAALDRVAAGWLAPDSPWRRRALAELPISVYVDAWYDSRLEMALRAVELPVGRP